MWRLRVVHSTGYAYKSPVTASFNEARLTPRSDSRQNVILNRVETVSAPLLQYLNRLSDLLFVMCRAINAAGGHPDVLWQQGRSRES